MAVVKLQKFVAGWVDVSGAVQRLSTNREGLRPELGEMRPGTAEVTLINTSGALTLAVLDVGMKVRIVKDADTIITGTVDAIVYEPADRLADYVAHVSIVGSDAPAQTTLRSGYEATVRRLAAGAAHRYWPLDDPPDQVYPRDPSRPGTITAQWAGQPHSAVDVMRSTVGGATLSPQSTILVVPGQVNNGGNDWHLSFAGALPKLTDGNSVIIYIAANGAWLTNPNGQFSLTCVTPSGVDLTTVICTLVQFRPGGSSATKVIRLVNDGAFHHFAWEGGVTAATISAYVDGQLQPADVNDANLGNARAASADPGVWGGNAGPDFSIGHIVNLPGTGYAPELARVAVTGSITAATFWDTASQRAAWVIGETGLPAGIIDDFPTLMRGVRGTDSGAEHLKILAQSVGALCYVTRDGAVNFQALSTVLNYAIGTTYELPMSRRRDRARVISACLASTPSGIGMGYAGSPGRQLDLTVLHLIPTDAQDRCQFLVDESQTGRVSIDGLRVRPAVGNRWAALLALELGNAISFVLNGTVFVGWIEGIRHDCGDHLNEWIMSITLSPLLIDPLILDDVTHGQLDEERLA
jgi:hypothetical protein